GQACPGGCVRHRGSDRGDRRPARAPAGLRRRRAGRDRRRRARGEPRGGREVPRRQRGGHRLPRRTGDESLRRVGEPEGGAGAPPRAPDRVGARVRVHSQRPPRYPWWQLLLLGVAGLAESAVWPLRRMWRSNEPIDGYGLVHFASAAGDALLAIALADSVFFSLPVDQAKLKVAAYLGLTMLPLAVAGPLLVIPLDRAGPRRAI